MVKELVKGGCFLCIVLFALIGCKNKGPKKIKSPEGYDFSSGKKVYLLSRLEEVSGIAFEPGSDSMLMAINDEEGFIFPVNINSPKSNPDHFKFAGLGDYEDICFYKGMWRVLQSNGTIHSTDIEKNIVLNPADILPEGEYEGMVAYGDTLFVICKECSGDKKGKATVFFINSKNDSMYVAGTGTMNAKDFIRTKSKKILASALARHPITNDWYILSHLNGCLFIADPQFRVKEYIKLSRSIFLQPEGIAFTSSGNLFISNEGDESSGSIMVFEYNVTQNP